ncbi:Major NAD(P)H-flavin oxidoreductase [Vibrio scophthalmi]|nr:Major NAD(P)H-flavin oxidoreductase [Vibrio scophthalmi]
MEGVDSELIGELFKEELDGYVCEVALSMGYHQDGADYNFGKPKARLPMVDILQVV